MTKRISPSPPRGIDEIDEPGEPEQRAHRFAIAGRDDLHRVLGEPGVGEPCAKGRAEGRVGARGLLPAAQEHRVAALDAERRGVDRHVGARLVDDRDDAERNRHLADQDAVRTAGQTGHRADRILLRRHVEQPPHRPFEPLIGERQAIDERRRRRAAFAVLRDVRSVRLEDGGGPFAQPLADGPQSGILFRPIGARERARRHPRPERERPHGLDRVHVVHGPLALARSRVPSQPRGRRSDQRAPASRERARGRAGRAASARAGGHADAGGSAGRGRGRPRGRRGPMGCVGHVGELVFRGRAGDLSVARPAARGERDRSAITATKPKRSPPPAAQIHRPSSTARTVSSRSSRGA